MLEIAKPVALGLCMLSLCAVFYTAFLVPASDLEQKTWDSLILLSLAAGVCLASGMLFREPAQAGMGPADAHAAGADVLLGGGRDGDTFSGFVVPGNLLRFLQGRAAVLSGAAGASG